MSDLVTFPVVDACTAKRYLRVVAAAAAVLLASLAATNVVVNPRSEFGTRLVPPLIPPYRAAKVQLFDKFAPPPTTIILGSSRMAAFPPVAIDRAGLGPTFNFAIPAGSIEDTLAVLRYAMRTDRALKRVIVGADYDRFDGSFPSRWPERQSTPLAAALSERISLVGRTKLLASSLSPGYVLDDLRAVGYLMRGRPPLDRTFDADGQMHYVAIERRIASGSFDFARAIHEDADISTASADYLRLYSALAIPDAGKLATYRRVVDEATQQGLTVRLVFLPLHPVLVSLLDETAFVAYRAATVRALRTLCRRGVQLFDFTMLETVDGDPNLFVDVTHPILDNYAKVAAAMERRDRDLCADR